MRKISPLFTIGKDKKRNKSVGAGLASETAKTVRVKANSDVDNAGSNAPKDAPVTKGGTAKSGAQAENLTVEPKVVDPATNTAPTESAAKADDTAKAVGSRKAKKVKKAEQASATTDLKKTDLNKVDSEKPDVEKTDVEKADLEKADSEKVESEKPDVEKTDVEKTVEKTDEKATAGVIADESADIVDTEADVKADAEPVSVSRRRGWWKWAVAAIVLLAIPVALFALVLSDIDRGRSSRGVDVAGVAVGNTSETKVAAAVAKLAGDFADSEITVETEQGPFTSTAGELGIAVDTEATVDEVMEIGHTGSTVAQVGAWFGSFTGQKSVPLVIEVPTQERVDDWVSDQAIDIESVEPVITRSRDGFDFEPGVVGRQLQTAPIVDSIPTRLNRPSLPVLAGAFDVLPPELADDAPSAIVDLVNRNTADGLDIRVAAETRNVDADVLRRWISIDTDTQDVDINEAAVDRFLSTEFADLAEDGDVARFEVVNREPKMIAPVYRGRICCREDSTQAVLDGVLDGESEVELRLDINPSTRTAEWAEGLKIVEEVGGFTTRHPCCAGRVRNIQRMADLVKGAIIEPGELFSLNEYVGKRTRENGFTGGGVIYNGVFTEDVGGGVSQFVTTLFNAAFFAGLDFGEYQSHSLYISRYPYGREATISWPAPDFQIKNNTDYGVLIWPSYTSGSITVRLYSTEHAPGEQVAQYKARGRCTNVETIRERTFPDGTKERDSVVATYRPAQGVRC